MNDRVMNALFLSTGNSARSIMAESLLNHHGHGWIRAFSAGSFPRAAVDPEALGLLERSGLPVEGLRCKSWDEFARPAAPAMDFVFTLCDDVAELVCPIWPGQPVTAHWSVPDPSRATGDEIERAEAYRDTLRQLERRIELLTMLPFASLDRLSLQGHVKAIGAHA